MVIYRVLKHLHTGLHQPGSRLFFLFPLPPLIQPVLNPGKYLYNLFRRRRLKHIIHGPQPKG